MNFSEALEKIKEGNKAARGSWSPGMAIYLVSNKFNNISHVEFRSKLHCVMYAASSEDLLANDWVLR